MKWKSVIIVLLFAICAGFVAIKWRSSGKASPAPEDVVVREKKTLIRVNLGHGMGSIGGSHYDIDFLNSGSVSLKPSMDLITVRKGAANSWIVVTKSFCGGQFQINRFSNGEWKVLEGAGIKSVSELLIIPNVNSRSNLLTMAQDCEKKNPAHDNIFLRVLYFYDSLNSVDAMTGDGIKRLKNAYRNYFEHVSKMDKNDLIPICN